MSSGQVYCMDSCKSESVISIMTSYFIRLKTNRRAIQLGLFDLVFEVKRIGGPELSGIYYAKTVAFGLIHRGRGESEQDAIEDCSRRVFEEFVEREEEYDDVFADYISTDDEYETALEGD